MEKIAMNLCKKSLTSTGTKGAPLGSPETDWYAVEKKLRAYLSASGIKLGPDEDLYTLDWRGFE
jgi:hypothetical protein